MGWWRKQVVVVEGVSPLNAFPMGHDMLFPSSPSDSALPSLHTGEARPTGGPLYAFSFLCNHLAGSISSSSMWQKKRSPAQSKHTTHGPIDTIVRDKA
ncbi:hypothetical protein VIGAN_09118700 [Vigna angularis var. angularis]|uniref:Uncharacterized protein n=1 Tax=Vigna angularis var. angularis TaxID=157739 RepID=A0A0S3SXN4_PHAAN|nr:hypothetical protein VIGAN_09118700 [Vigna angularis var. angularis]